MHDEPCRKSRRQFFPLPVKWYHAGMGIAKDAMNDSLWLATREAIQIGESSSFSHVRFVPFFSMLRQQ
jgi:hypothetical protein